MNPFTSAEMSAIWALIERSQANAQELRLRGHETAAADVLDNVEVVRRALRRHEITTEMLRSP